MNKPIIYLCGAMQLVSTDEGQIWRQKAIVELRDKYELLNPYDWVHKYKDEKTGVIFDSEGMVTADLSAIDKSNLLIVNVDNHGFGTTSELTYGYYQGKGTYTYGKYLNHPFVSYHASHKFDNLDDIIEYLKDNAL